MSLALSAACLFGSCCGAQAETTTEALIESGNRLAAVVRAGRSVLSENQDLINDPHRGDKGLSAEVFMDQVETVYIERNGEPPVVSGLNEMQVRLTEAQLEAMAEIVLEVQDLINAKGIGFKGIIPASFARMVNERFGEKVGDLAMIKVTAPPELVRNRKALPDPWELEIIRERFLDPGWDHGGVYHQVVDGESGPLFRMLLPEYYGATCLTCHGLPKGEVDVTGFPKEGAKEGDLGGAISITLTP